MKQRWQIIVTVTAVVIVGVIVGGGVYAYQQKQTRAALEQQTLPVTTQNPDTTTTPANTTPASSFVFDLAKAKIGDKVGTMTIVSIKKAIENDNPLSSDNVLVEFSGQQTVSGTYNYSADGTDFSPHEFLEFSIDTASFTTSIPHLASDPEVSSALYLTRGEFSNLSEAKKILDITAPIADGKATIILDRYRLFRCACDGGAETFSLVSASSIVDNVASWQSFSSRYFTLSFKIPQDFEVREDKNYIAIAKKPYTAYEIGSNNAFFQLTTFSETNTRQEEINRYRQLLQNKKESTITLDGNTFLSISGDDWGRFGGDSAGLVTTIFLDKSWIEIIDRPGNKDTDSTFYSSPTFNDSPTSLSIKVLSTLKFTK